MKISMASDHAGFQLKENLKSRLISQSHEILDRGCFDDSSVDYPDFGVLAAKDVASGTAERAVLICGSGIGMSIVANKVKGVRAALCLTTELAEMSRRHNDANVLVLGARFVEPVEAFNILDVWFSTPFEGGRHQRRVDKIGELGDY
jgi:ribose 5-phosphate isomerase B